MLKCIKSALVLAVLVALALLAYVYSGAYDVAASRPDAAGSSWLLSTVRQRSIETRAADITVPPLADPKLIQEGFEHYHEMCAGCHLAPGIESSEIHEGLNPQPPVLAEVVPHSTPAKLFWTIKNGIRMTGMPAWGNSHSDQMIWAMVAFLEQLPKMTPAEYKAMEAQQKNMDDDHAMTMNPKAPDAGAAAPGPVHH